MLAIKYGKPQPTEEWLATLPEPVLRAVARDVLTMFLDAGKWPTPQICNALSIRFGMRQVDVEAKILEALHTYHALLGQV